MPTVSMFFGIKIYLYTNEHNPPHFHAVYQGHEATYDMEGGKIEGDMPHKQDKLISAWAIIHHQELMDNWEIAAGGESPYRIDPLR